MNQPRPVYDETFFLHTLHAVIKSDFLELIANWDQHTCLSAIEELIEDCQVNRMDYELTPEESNLIDSLNFDWLVENEVLKTLSYNLNERIERRGYFIEDFDGKGFQKVALSLVKKRMRDVLVAA